ncbi:MAG: peptide deformylase [bacterium]|nr:peptide deformylase [bacterium]
MTEDLSFDLTLFPAPVLRKVAEPVEAFDEDVARTVEAMFELMFKSKGVGLAAPQVGLKRRILVLNETGEQDKPEQNLVLINPTILATSGPRKPFEEGCLSFPGIYAEVQRPECCKVEAHDVHGERFEADYDGFTSRIIQHEHDHLEGVLLVDRMSPVDKLRNRGALEELVDVYKASKV